MESPQGRKYNFVIFGPTGITGKYLVQETILKTLKRSENNPKFTWAIAGRSVGKMEALLRDTINELGLKDKDILKVDKIMADVSNDQSIKSMVAQCHIVLNCVGPYLKFGEILVQACVQLGTHHIDVSAESLFLYRMKSKYEKVAEQSGSLIISACGFESVPSDFGSALLQKNFEGTLNSLKSYMEIPTSNGNGGYVPKLTYGTWESLLSMKAYESEFKTLKNQFIDNQQTSGFKRNSGASISLQRCLDGWCTQLPFPANTDEESMEYTQQYKSNQGFKPLHTQMFLKLPNLFFAAAITFALFLLNIVIRFKIGRDLLLKFPRLTTLGLVSREPPTNVELNTIFSYTVVAEGWPKNTSNFNSISALPTKKSVLKIEFKNAYRATAKIMLEAAITIQMERNKMPKRGGIYTPGIAFCDTSFAKRLTETGVIFKFNEQIEKNKNV